MYVCAELQGSVCTSWAALPIYTMSYDDMMAILAAYAAGLASVAAWRLLRRLF